MTRTATLSETIAPPKPTLAPLMAIDRCDKCSARATTIVTLKNGGYLIFCGHHTGEYRAALISEGASLNESATKTVEAR